MTSVSTGDVTMGEVLEQRELFGGAMQIKLPSRLVDVSDFRPIPDSQEVLADANTDESLIVEIVEHNAEGAKHAIPAEFFFKDLAEVSDAVSTEIISLRGLGAEETPLLDSQFPKSTAVGKLRVAKGRQSDHTANLIQVAVTAILLEHVDSDVLITLNTPLAINELSAAAQHAGAGMRDSEVPNASQELYAQILSSFKIVDWSLFGENETDNMTTE